MKKIKLMIVSFALILTMLLTPIVALAQYEGVFSNVDYTRGSQIRVFLEGNQLYFDVVPQIVNGRVLVPMKKIFESFGLTVTWDNELRTARGTNQSTDITFAIGSDKAIINGLTYPLDVPAQIIGGSTMVPLKFLSQNMNYNVIWNGDSQLILISKSPIIEWQYEGFEAVKPYKEYELKYINGEKTDEFRYNGKNHEVTFLNLYQKDGTLIQNVPDFKVRDYGSGWSTNSPFAGKTYWIHIDELAKGIQANPIYLEQNLSQLNFNDIKGTAEVGNYVKVQINKQYFDLNQWKTVIGRQDSVLYPIMDETALYEKSIDPNDTLFQVKINDNYNTVVSFKTLNGPVFNRNSEKVYTVLEKSPAALFNWDAQTWTRIEQNIPWEGMTKDMLLVQYKTKPDQTTKLTTKFNNIELWIYTEDYGDLIYYFKGDVLTSIL